MNFEEIYNKSLKEAHFSVDRIDRTNPQSSKTGILFEDIEDKILYYASAVSDIAEETEKGNQQAAVERYKKYMEKFKSDVCEFIDKVKDHPRLISSIKY